MNTVTTGTKLKFNILSGISLSLLVLILNIYILAEVPKHTKMSKISYIVAGLGLLMAGTSVFIYMRTSSFDKQNVQNTPKKLFIQAMFILSICNGIVGLVVMFGIVGSSFNFKSNTNDDDQHRKSNPQHRKSNNNDDDQLELEPIIRLGKLTILPHDINRDPLSLTAICNTFVANLPDSWTDLSAPMRKECSMQTLLTNLYPSQYQQFQTQDLLNIMNKTLCWVNPNIDTLFWQLIYIAVANWRPSPDNDTTFFDVIKDQDHTEIKKAIISHYEVAEKLPGTHLLSAITVKLTEKPATTLDSVSDNFEQWALSYDDNNVKADVIMDHINQILKYNQELKNFDN